MIMDVLVVLLHVLLAVGAAVAFATLNARLLAWVVRRSQAARRAGEADGTVNVWRLPR